MTTLGQSGTKTTGESRWVSDKRAYLSILDGLIGEMETRFGTGNESQKLIQSLTALVPSPSNNFLAKGDSLYLVELLKLDINMIDGELATAAKFIRGKLASTSSLAEGTRVIYSYREAFPNTYALYAGAATAYQ